MCGNGSCEMAFITRSRGQLEMQQGRGLGVKVHQEK